MKSAIRLGFPLRLGSCLVYSRGRRMPEEILRGVEARAERAAQVSSPVQDPWPFVAGRRLAFLLDAASSIERGLLEQWIEAHRPESISPSSCEWIAIPSSRRGRGAADRRLEECLAVGDDPLLAPLRIAWLPPEKDGSREVRFSDLVTLGDPRDPGLVRQTWLRRNPDRYRVVVAEPAPASVLRGRWQREGADSTLSLTEFVVRQAHLALERAERRLRGSRYKVPRFVHEEILARPAFRGAMAVLARERGVPEAVVADEAAGDLREIAATHSPYVIDLTANLIRVLYTRGYGERLHYDRAQLRDIYALTQRYPVVFLPSHKSNLDHLVLQYALHENGHPPNHTAGGINMNFFPIGPLIRRSGLFFIRRTFKDDPVYKLVLRQYIDYLIEKRFSLEWYVEGGRSRSGKLSPPRLGLLAYVVDSFRRGRAEDVYLIPTAIAYDQIQDVGDYVAESRGAAKQRESFGWFLKVLRGIQNRLGNIYIRFGEPLSLAAALGRAESIGDSETDEQSLAVAKIAFEVAVRINRVTPITPTSLVTLAMLGADRAVTVEETVIVLRNWVDYVRRRGLPTTEELKLNTAEGVRAVLETLVSSGVVTSFSKGPEPVYAIGENQHLAAAYYRNTIVHFFVNSSIAELSLLRAAEADVSGPRGRVLGRGAAPARSLEVRVLLRGQREVPRRDSRGGEARRARVGSAARGGTGGDPQAPAPLSSVHRPSRAATVPRGLPDRRRRARAARLRRPIRRAGVPRPLPRPGRAISATAAHAERGVGIERAVRDGAQAGGEPRVARTRRRAGDAAASGLRGGAPPGDSPRRGRGGSGRQPPRGTPRLKKLCTRSLPSRMAHGRGKRRKVSKL